MTEQADIAIIGGGIIGLATGYQLTKLYPDKKIVLLEKEAELAHHQTGRNSGVLHSGIYYKPGSLKALNCREGREAMEAFCRREGITFERCGKVIVAVHESQFPLMQNIYDRGQANGVTCEIIDGNRLAEIEPHTAGIQAIHVPDAGIVDYRGVSNRLGEIIRENGGSILTNARVTAVHQQGERVVVESVAGDVEARVLVNCAGLHSDRITQLSGQTPEAKIVPFRGEFYQLKPEAEHLCRHLIYPVPDPRFPFLGVHFTRLALGGVECGPNAVLAFSREGYRKTDINVRDLFESLTYPGFLRMAARHWKTGLAEMWRSVSKQAFVRALQSLVPDIKGKDLITAPSGVRAQALRRDGNLVDDFLIQSEGPVVNVINAPSPAATAALNVGRLVVKKLAERF